MHLSSFVFRVAEDQAESAQILEEVYRLRYQVYVKEWGFEKPEEHPHGLEKDDYDKCSRHFYALCDSEAQTVVGTARLIIGSDSIFPIEKHFDIPDLPSGVKRDEVAEISRLAISKDFRRRVIDQFIFNKDAVNPDVYDGLPVTEEIKYERRKCEHELIRGIYLLVYRESLKLGLTHWYAVMTRGLQIILKRWGIPFQQVGPEKEYHGVRAPYILSIRDLESCLQKKNPELLELARLASI